jgi:hypothetical protein
MLGRIVVVDLQGDAVGHVDAGTGCRRERRMVSPQERDGDIRVEAGGLFDEERRGVRCQPHPSLQDERQPCRRGERDGIPGLAGHIPACRGHLAVERERHTQDLTCRTGIREQLLPGAAILGQPIRLRVPVAGRAAGPQGRLPVIGRQDVRAARSSDDRDIRTAIRVDVDLESRTAQSKHARSSATVRMC